MIFQAILLFLFIEPAQAAQPPKVMYHYGEQKYLMRNAQIDEVPKDEWDQFIMGTGTSYELPYPRRGLYGGTKLSTISHYTPNCGGGKTPWIVAIHIKDECRDPKVVGDISDLSHDEKFKKWFDENLDKKELIGLLGNSAIFSWASHNCRPIVEDYDKFAQSAFESTGKPRIRYHKWHKIEGGQNENTEVHEYVLNEWIKFNKFKVMLNDNAEEKPSQQWYLRDRSCVEKLDGTPEEVLEMVAKRPDYWDNFRQKYKPDDYDSPLTIFLRAAAEAKSLNPNTMQEIRQMVSEPSTRMPAQWKANLPSVLEELAKCKKEAYGPALQPFYTNYEKSCQKVDVGAMAQQLRSVCNP